MIPGIGQHVKIVFRNNAIVEGIVVEWTTGSVQLKSLDDKSTLIINHPDEDIMLIKIIHEEPVAEEPKIKMVDKGTHIETSDGRYSITWPHQREVRWEDEERAEYGLDAMREEFRKRIYANPADAELDRLDEKFQEAAKEVNPINSEEVKTLAELKVSLNKVEKEIVASKLKNHIPSPYKPKTTPYHYAPVIYKNRSAYDLGNKPNGKPRSPKK